MRATLQRWLAAPRFADPETDRIARSAHVCAVAFMGILILWMPVAYVFQDATATVPGVGFSGLAVLLVVVGLARRGQARAAAGLLVALLYGAACFGMWVEGGLMGTSTGTFLAIVVAASLFFSLRVAWLAGAVSVLTLFGFWYGEAAGLLPPPQTFGSERVLISTLTVMAVMAALVQLNTARLRESERFLAAITDAAPNALYVYDLSEGTLVYGNQASRRQLGWSGTPAEDPERFERAVHPEDWEALRNHAVRVARAGDDELLELEYRARHADGSWRIIRDRARVFDRTGDGGVRQIIGVAEDVTAEREAEGVLERSRDRLRRGERLEALGQLAGGIAHDFNNYLTVIVGATEAAARELGEDRPALRDLVDDAHVAAQRSAELTRQLLGFSQHRMMQPRTFDLNELLRDSDRLLRRVIPVNIELDLSLGEDLPPIHADPGQIEQVVLNLVVNARDAMPGGGHLRVATEAVTLDDAYLERQPDARPGPHLVLSVADTGSGMDEETRAQIFEPLFTTKGSGTGFGLATVDAIVRQAGGHVQVDSEPEVGTCFRVYLPCADGEAGVVGAAGSRHDHRGTESVLLVEDDPMVRRFTLRALGGVGYQVTAAGDGPEGLRIFREQPTEFDLVLTDIMLPGMSGLEMANELRELAPGLPVVFMSGYTAQALGDQELAPKEHLLHKPFTLEDLRRAIRRALEER